MFKMHRTIVRDHEEMKKAVDAVHSFIVRDCGIASSRTVSDNRECFSYDSQCKKEVVTFFADNLLKIVEILNVNETDPGVYADVVIAVTCTVAYVGDMVRFRIAVDGFSSDQVDRPDGEPSEYVCKFEKTLLSDRHKSY